MIRRTDGSRRNIWDVEDRPPNMIKKKRNHENSHKHHAIRTIFFTFVYSNISIGPERPADVERTTPNATCKLHPNAIMRNYVQWVS